MAIKISNGFNLISFSIQLYFIGFHYFLDSGSNFTQGYINTSGLENKNTGHISQTHINRHTSKSKSLKYLNSSVGGISNCFNKFIILRVERKSECTINDAS